MNIASYFSDRKLKIGFNITLESHHNNHANSKLVNKPNYSEFGTEVRYISKIMRELSVFHAKLKNQKNSNIKQFFQQDLINRIKMIKYYMKQKYSLI